MARSAPPASSAGVVVTGAAGFVGRHVVRTLRDAGHVVTGLDRREWHPVPGEHRVRLDLLDPDAQPLLARAEAVVHLAGCPGVRDRRRDVGRWRFRDNVLAGAAVLDAVPAGTPLVVASSSSVYGGAGTPSAPRACREDDPRHPRGGYARSKAVLEDLCGRRRDRGGRVTVLRPFTVAGEGQRPDMALARWIEAARYGTPVRVLGSLDRRRDVTDVRDLARAVERALALDVDGLCNVGTGTTHTLGAMLDAVAETVGVRPTIETLPAAREEVPATRADVSRCRAMLGFVPRTDLPELVRRQADASRLLAATA